MNWLLVFLFSLAFCYVSARMNRLGYALEEVLGRMRDLYEPDSLQSKIRKQCWGSAVCNHPTPDISIDNVVFKDGKLYVDLDETTSEIPELSPLNSARQNSITGPDIVRDSKYAYHCFWGDFFSSANMRSTHAVFGLPQSSDDTFRVFNDNVLSVLADVVIDFLLNDEPRQYQYSLYQYPPFNATSPKPNHPSSLLYELLPIIFEPENVHPVNDLLSGGPHCVKEVLWTAAKKPIYKDILADLRKACYDVLHHVLQEYTSITTATTTPNSISSTTIHKPRAIIVSREDVQAPSRKMNKQSELQLAFQFEQAGFQAEVCCDFRVINTIDKLIEKFRGVDVCVGVHGAGLSNCVLGKRGVTIIELQTHHHYGAVMFQKLAHMMSGHYVFHDVRLNVKMKDDPVLEHGFVMSDTVMQDVVDVSKRLYVYAQRIAMTNHDASTENSSMVGEGAPYTPPPSVSEVVVVDYAHSTVFSKPTTTYGNYLMSALGYDNFTSDSIVAWSEQVKRRDARTGAGERQNLLNVLKRNKRTYWIELNPYLPPYTRETILRPPEEDEEELVCVNQVYNQFRQMIHAPHLVQSHSCELPLVS